MNCEICGAKEPTTLALLPTHKEDGSLNTMVCERCFEKSPAYCRKHQQIHLGFTDGTTACPRCVDEMKVRTRHLAESLQDRIRQISKPDEFKEISEYIKGASYIMDWSADEALHHFLITKAVRAKLDAEKVLSTIIKEKLPLLLIN